MSSLKCMGVLAHPLRPQTAPIAERIAESLRAHGIETWVHTRWKEADVAEQVRGADMVVAIGGDGAMLRAARVCAPHKVPLFGVNTGYLGFLAEISDPEGWEAHFAAVMRGDYWIEERMMIHATLWQEGVATASGDALNDVVISRGVVARTVRLETYIDADWATTYNADALIIATATGSTAYALACGGPILPPELHNILIVPVAPHLSMERPIVLSEGSTVEVRPAADITTEIVLTIDGMAVGNLQASDCVEIRASEHISRFVRLRDRNYFYRSLLDRMEPRLALRSEPQQAANIP